MTRRHLLPCLALLGLIASGCGGKSVAGGDRDAGDPPSCTNNEECQDELFCNGREVCDPDADGANEFGCIAATTAACSEDTTCNEDTDMCDTECDVNPDADSDGEDAVACGGTDCNDSDPDINAAATEICDDVDNDCDDSTDESFNLGDACNGVGLCGAGAIECRDDGTAGCSTDAGGSAAEDVAELCDGLDNDCDGQADENLGLGDDCDGAGECGAGTVECAADGSVICSTEAGGSADETEAELCDDLDHDCDGETTNGFEIGMDCDGAGECGMGVFECKDDGTRTCSTSADGSAYVPQTDAICDGLDADCDGLVDEEFMVGDVCDGAGACGEGVVECTGDDATSTRCSTDPGGSANSGDDSDPCDGQDNDCDGVVDEGFGIGMSCDGVGQCGAGVLECLDAATATCSTDRTQPGSEAEDEVCDGADNDCDSMTDEDFNLGSECTGVGVCGTVTGELECNLVGGTVCSVAPGGTNDQSSSDICDGLDNDCDGEIDDDFGIGNVCDGVGECGSGIRECAGTGDTRCSTDIGGSNYDGISELCNGRDDDCDGEIDEDFNIGDSCAGVGVCGAGVFECANINSARCSTHPGGSDYVFAQDICDNQDNDCNGIVDDGYNTGSVCDPPGDVCGAGIVECSSPTATRCSTGPGGSADQSSTELCDAVDHDCDGDNDEGFNIGVACNGVGECGNGVFECGVDGGGDPIVRCSSDPGGTSDDTETEVCNGRDDDCDGNNDEDFDLGTACTGTGECGVGFWQCSANNVTRICSSDPGGAMSDAVAEVCDGLDNDCDGNSDEASDISMCGGVLPAQTTGITCNMGSCEITSCQANYENADDVFGTGCECELESESVDVCGDAMRIDTLEDIAGGEDRAIAATLSSGADVDWYWIRVANTTDTNNFNTLIQVSSADPNIKMDVRLNGCSTSADTVATTTGSCSGIRVHTFDPNEANCDPNPSDNSDFRNTCNSAAAREYYVRVYYDGSTADTCLAYSIRFANGFALP